MLSGITVLIFVIISFWLARKAFDNKDKAYGAFFSILGIVLLATAINGGMLYKLWMIVVNSITWVIDAVVFLITGQIYIYLAWIYVLVFAAFFIGLLVMGWHLASKKAEKKASTIDGRKVAQKMREGK